MIKGLTKTEKTITEEKTKAIAGVEKPWWDKHVDKQIELLEMKKAIADSEVLIEKEKITEEEFETLFPNFNIVKLFDSINKEEWKELVGRKYHFDSLNLEINVFYDFKDKRILFKNNNKNSASIVNLGKINIEVSKTSSKKTPMLTAIISGDLSKIKKRTP